MASLIKIFANYLFVIIDTPSLVLLLMLLSWVRWLMVHGGSAWGEDSGSAASAKEFLKHQAKCSR